MRRWGGKSRSLRRKDACFPCSTREFGQSVSMNLKKAGAQVHTDALVKRVLREGERVRVEFEVRGKAAECAAQAALVATGRRANTQGLFANGFDLQMHKGCIVVDDHFETSVPGVYAIGDVTGGIQLAHAASAQGMRVWRAWPECPPACAWI